jgi:hypothetical protein
MSRLMKDFWVKFIFSFVSNISERCFIKRLKLVKDVVEQILILL